MKEKWIVAVSGGPDSMALLDIVNKENKDEVYIVAHVNYHMRSSSDDDMKIVMDYAKEHGLQFRCLDFEPHTQIGNFQKEARNFRYDFFKRLVREYGASGVLLAHHLDDDMETYVFQKERKMKSDAVGLQEESEYKGIVLKRPLLKYRKQELIDYCEDNGIAYAIDSSNSDTKYTRNRIRKTLSEMHEEQWQKTYDKMLEEKKLWKDYQDTLQEGVKLWKTQISVTDFKNLDHKEDHLRMWLRINGVSVHDLTEEYLREMSKALCLGKGYFELDGWILEGAYGSIWLEKEVNVYDVHKVLKYKQFETYEFSREGTTIQGVNLTENDFPIIVRNAKGDDVIEMKYGTKKLRRHFIDRKIPKGKRKNTLVIENSLKHIVFVVGLGSDVHHYANNHNLFVIKL